MSASMQVGIAPARVAAATEVSGTIATGGTAQQALPANPSRRAVWVQAGAAEIWFRIGATATQAVPSRYLGPRQLYESPPGVVETGAVSINGATGAAYAAGEL